MRKVMIGLALLLSFVMLGCYHQTKPSSVTLNVYIPAELAFTDVFDLFEKEHGIHVNITQYKDPERMYEKVSRGAENFDVVIAPADYVSGLMRDNALLELDKALLTNYTEVMSEELLGVSYDYDNRYSYPYIVRATGLNVDNSKLSVEQATSWSILADPQYAGAIGLRADERSLLGIALKHLNYSANSVDEGQVQEAKALVQAWLANGQPLTFSYQDHLFSEGLLSASYDFPDMQTLADYHNGQAEHYQFVLVPEGGIVEAETMAILDSTQHIEEAHVLINHLLEAPVQAMLVDHFGGISLLRHVDELRAYPAPYTFEQLIEYNYEARSDVDWALRYYNAAWHEILTDHTGAMFTKVDDSQIEEAAVKA